MSNIFTKKINEPQLDSLAAKRILENALFECGMNLSDEEFEVIEERFKKKIDGKSLSFIHKIKNIRSAHHEKVEKRTGYIELGKPQLGQVLGGNAPDRPEKTGQEDVFLKRNQND